MFKYILKKGLSLAVALVFAITTVAQATPVQKQSANTLRAISLANAPGIGLTEELQLTLQKPGFNKQRLFLEKLSSKLRKRERQEVIAINQSNSVFITIEKVYGVEGGRLTNFLEKKSPEPVVTWERLLYYLAAGKIRFAKENLKAITEAELKELAEGERVSFDQSGEVYPSVAADVIAGEDHHLTLAYLEIKDGEKTDKVIYGYEYNKLDKAQKKNYKAVYLIHVPEETWKEIEKSPAAQAEVIIHQWTRHFMPSFRNLSPQQHADLQVKFFRGLREDKSKAELYSEIFDSVLLNLIEEAKSAKGGQKVRLLYEYLANYQTFSDPTGEIKEAIYEQLKGIEFNVLIEGIKTNSDLLAFYRFLFENAEVINTCFKDKKYKKTLTTKQQKWVKDIITDRGIEYHERVRAISIIFERSSKDNSVIRRNLSSNVEICLFNYLDPTQPEQTVYIPINIGTYISEDEFNKWLLVPEDKAELLKLEAERNGLILDRDRLRANREALKDQKKTLEELTEKTDGISKNIKKLKKDIKGINKKIKKLNKEEIDETTKVYTLIYNEPLLERIKPIIKTRVAAEQERSQQEGRQRRCVMVGVYGPTSAGKTTLAVDLMKRLQAGDCRANYIGSDSYLHPGEGFRYDKLRESERYTYLRGQGIYDLERFYQDLKDIKEGRPVTVAADVHAPGYNPGEPTREIPGGLHVIVVDLTVFGMNQQLAKELDFIIPITFTTDAIRHGRRIERDARPKEEGGSDRNLSREYVLNEFVEKQFEELYDNMRPLVDLGFAHLILRQREYDVELFMKKDTAKKAPGAEALNSDEERYIQSLIADGVTKHKFEIVPVTDELIGFIKDHVPPELLEKIKSGKVQLRVVDVGPYAGFPRSKDAKTADRLVYAYRTEKDGVTYINITKVMQLLCLPYYDKSEAQKEVGLATLAQLLAHEFLGLERRPHSEAVKTDKALSSKYVTDNNIGVPDIDLLILRQAAENGAFDYFSKLLREYDAGKDPEGKFIDAIINALAKTYFLHLTEVEIKKKIQSGTLSPIEAAAAGKALQYISTAIDDALEKKGIYKKQDLRGIAYESKLDTTEQVCAEVAYRLGLSMAKNYRERLEKEELRIALGMDARVHSPRVYEAMKKGLLDAGVKVVNLASPDNTTPMVSTAVYRTKILGKLDGAVQITSSHNDFRYNGFKLFLEQKNTPTDLLAKIVKDAAGKDLKPAAKNAKKGKFIDKGFKFRKAYKNEVVEFIKGIFGGKGKPFIDEKDKKKKFAVEGVNGASGELFAEVLEECGAEVVRLHCDSNGYFPYFMPNPDPEQTVTRAALTEALKDDPSIEAGVAFDSDGDRLFFSSRNGNGISNHELECLFADKIKGTVVVNSRTTMAVFDVKTEKGEKDEIAHKCKSGYSYIKAKAKCLEASAGMEESGHFMFKEGSYIDDGMKTAAMVFGYAAEVQSGEDLKTVIDKLPFKKYCHVFGINTKELPIDKGELEKTKNAIKQLEEEENIYFAELPGCKIWQEETDSSWREAGVYVEFEKETWGFSGWMQFRPSLSEPNKAYLDFEATAGGKPSPIGVWHMMCMMREILSKYPQLKVAADLLTPEKVKENEEIDADVRAIANSIVISSKQDYTVYTLTDKDSGSSIEVVPGRGATITGMKVKIADQMRDILYQPPDIEKSGGIPVLWPYANRIKEGTFIWDHKKHSLSKVEGTKDDAKGHTYHGMVRYAKWTVEDAGVDENGVFIKCSLDTVGYPSIKEHFGKARITLTYRLKENQLEIDTSIANKDKHSIPMSLAFHPWIKVPLGPNPEGSKARCKVKLPASKHWISDAEHIPTGELKDVAGNKKYDLRQPLKLEEDPGEGKPDTYDDVFTGLTFNKAGKATSALYDLPNKVVVEVSATENFQHVVLNVPSGKPAVCIEPQTSSTDAFNLHKRGIEESTLVVLEPGETFEGKVWITVSQMSQTSAQSSGIKPSSAGKEDLPIVDIETAREAYRYIGVSIGGNKLAVSINDGNNNIVDSKELRWDDDGRFKNGQVKQVSKAEEVMDTIVGMATELLKDKGVDANRINLVAAGLAGPVDKEKGIFGSDFKTPSLPFEKYPFREELIRRLSDEGINVRVEMCNDAEAARNGERFSPEGQLRGISGGIVIIGGGINISVDDERVKEAGHNLYQVKDAEGKIHYAWSGDKTKGRHPIERGNAPGEIKRISGDIGEEYVNSGEKEFTEKYPEYPFIEWADGLRDFEDRLSGPNIRRRLKEAIDLAKTTKSQELNEYLAIEETASKQERKGELERALTPEALKKNKVATRWIKNIAEEVGKALAAFISAYRDEEFARHLVLVSGVSENLGKGVYETEEDKTNDLDIFIKTLRQSAKGELVDYFKMPQQKAQEAVNGIVRSKMDYRRELTAHQPTDEEVLEAYQSFNAESPSDGSVKFSSAGEKHFPQGKTGDIAAITAGLEKIASTLLSQEAAKLDTAILDKTVSTYQKAIDELSALKAKSAKKAAEVAEPLRVAGASLGLMTLSRDIAAEEAKIAEESRIIATIGTIIINDAEIPANQEILLTLLDKESGYLKALEEKLGCKVRLLSQFDSTKDTSANMIAISRTKIDTIPNLRYINIKAVAEDIYLPLEQVIVFAKGLLVYGIDKSATTETAISNIYRLLAKRPIQKELFEEFLKPNGVFVLSLPAPTPVDERYYGDLHRQAMAALIAA